MSDVIFRLAKSYNNRASEVRARAHARVCVGLCAACVHVIYTGIRVRGRARVYTRARARARYEFACGSAIAFCEYVRNDGGVREEGRKKERERGSVLRE